MKSGGRGVACPSLPFSVYWGNFLRCFRRPVDYKDIEKKRTTRRWKHEGGLQRWSASATLALLLLLPPRFRLRLSVPTPVPLQRQEEMQGHGRFCSSGRDHLRGPKGTLPSGFHLRSLRSQRAQRDHPHLHQGPGQRHRQDSLPLRLRERHRRLRPEASLQFQDRGLPQEDRRRDFRRAGDRPADRGR